MRSRLNHPPPDTTWIHRDRLSTAPERRPWAIQTWVDGRLRWWRATAWRLKNVATIDNMTATTGEPWMVVAIVSPHRVRRTPNGGILIEGVWDGAD